jgi:sec-independent protein translocase protein TatC
MIKKRVKRENSEEDGLTFWQHLDELRARLIRVAIAVFAGTILAFLNREIIFDKIILAPMSDNFVTARWMCALGRFFHVESLCMQNMKFNLINVEMTGQFMTHITISFVAGIMIAMPYIFWQLWQFIKPALYEKERRYAGRAVFIMTFLFIVGVLFSYYIMVPWTVTFLGTYQVSKSVQNLPSLGSYISTVLSTILMIGVAFELPVVVFVLAKVGLMTPDFLKKNRKIALVIVLVIAAIITPSTDIFSQIIVTIPLWALYEISILVAKRVAPSVEQ